MNIQRAANQIVAGAAFLLVGMLGIPAALSGMTAQADQPTASINLNVPSGGALVEMTNHRCHILPTQGRGPGSPIIRPECDVMPQKAPSGLASTDLNYNGGPLVTSAGVNVTFVNCATMNCSDWGNPAGSLSDLFVSNFIHMTDQYVNTRANGRYGVSGTATATGSLPHVLLDSQLRGIVAQIVHAFFPNGGGGGYSIMYSVFLPAGQDLCFDNSNQCYCPDNNCNGGQFAFCAYHGSFDTTDAKGVSIHVLYQAQPYDNVNGCAVTNGPNGSLIDSVNNVFSHEIFETITDPDVGTGWVRNSDGQEIGDICNFNEQNPVTLNGNKYSIQKEYSNAVHACAAGALGLVNLTHDFNLDGMSDVLWYNATSGQLVNWLLNGTGVTAGGSLGSAGSPWAVVGQRDFNGEGKFDVLWRNGTTGQLVAWLLNGGSVIGGGSFGAAASPLGGRGHR